MLDVEDSGVVLVEVLYVEDSGVVDSGVSSGVSVLVDEAGV